ncbi:hypothetical protein B0H11DRAFT_1956558 [Mycena galericulata]|nr:hypothetical protein B0H11DRAFT_2015213 [Mycena galericulata]KAJ7510913.1 hypothetical protein B0H11DRAFT_1956558 [Mycena galericulata]
MAALRAAHRAHIESIQAEIVALKQSIRGLRSQQKRIRKRLHSYTYPVLALPNEILSEIFLHFIPAYPRCAPREGRRSPLLLAHVCRDWRETALATPTLWRAIPLGGYNSSQDHIRFLESWLSRSGDLPLSIQMNDQHSGVTAAELELIISYRARLEVVSLQVEFLSDLVTLQDSLPRLRSLEIRELVNRVSAPSRIAFHGVPHLRAATLWDFVYPADLLPWSQLTSLKLVAKGTADITQILREIPQLVHCQLIVYDSVAPQLNTTLAFLESLILMSFAADVDDPTPPSYLDTFVLPSLRRLQIPDEFLRPAPVDALTSFINNSGCKLQEILITGERIVPKWSYRKAFPDIKKFIFDSALVDYMTWNDSFASDLDVEPSFDLTSDESSSDSEW